MAMRSTLSASESARVLHACVGSTPGRNAARVGDASPTRMAEYRWRRFFRWTFYRGKHCVCLMCNCGAGAKRPPCSHRAALSGRRVPLVSYCVTAVTKFNPSGTPTPVTLSQPAPVVSPVSVLNVITYQRVDPPW